MQAVTRLGVKSKLRLTKDHVLVWRGGKEKNTVGHLYIYLCVCVMKRDIAFTFFFLEYIFMVIFLCLVFTLVVYVLLDSLPIKVFFYPNSFIIV